MRRRHVHLCLSQNSLASPDPVLSTEIMRSDTATPKINPEPVGLQRLSARVIGLTAIVFMLIYAVIRVNWLPVILPDSLLYLDHSNDLIGEGLVQVGFRQFGYPLWLASVDVLAGLLDLEPLALTVILQRLLLVLSAGLATYVLRWWATPIVAVLVLPTTIAYSNFILTEAMAVPIAVIAAVACVRLFIAREDRAIGWLATASLAAAALPIIRLHYGILTVAIIATIALTARDRSAGRRSSTIAIVGIIISTSLLVLALSIENKAENDIFSPSLGSERVLFWSTWEKVVPQNSVTVAAAIPDVYLNGTPDAFILMVDESDMSFADKNAAYASASKQIYDVTGASLNAQRFSSFLGVLGGARFDDLASILLKAARPTAASDIERYVNQYGTVTPVDPEDIAHRFNSDRPPSAVLTIADRIPGIPSPYVGFALAVLVPSALLGGFYLLQFRNSRRPALVGTGTLLSYAVVSSVFLMDNLRYLLPAYLFAIVLISGAASLRWGSRAHYSTSSSTISLPRS
ncbi:MAG: hypothetical protein BMS9Abin17_0525 [Acidimicrobiia bacterium]|nr:MAG: hypothetical protein BMS9Abin17_0525 [Acidimicrobiia bacterium]